VGPGPDGRGSPIATSAAVGADQAALLDDPEDEDEDEEVEAAGEVDGLAAGVDVPLSEELLSVEDEEDDDEEPDESDPDEAAGSEAALLPRESLR
jgi:hypothetical protein